LSVERLRFEDLPADPSLADPLPASPFAILGRWLDEARRERATPNPDAVALATADEAGHPAVRMVLCRGFDPEDGSIVWYTNRRSRKGRELAAQPWASAAFFWDGTQRQARLEGPVAFATDAESDAYFASRPRNAQISAWASDQSEPIASRHALLEKLRDTEARFASTDPVPRPPHWGGYRLRAERVELWVGSAGRAHDRVRWERAARGWSATRLQP
jgi:pyridoxamine 5'-phosphate oxidase